MAHNATISVTNDAGFITAEFIGSGTLAEPYILENKAIEGHGTENLISINDTSAYFVIRNMTLNGGKNGIVLHNADNAYIIDNTIHDNNINGIKIEDSTNIVFENNEIFGNGGDICPHSLLSVNQLRLNTHSGGGLHFDPSSDSVVISNNIYENSIAGIIIEDATNITINANTIEDNGSCPSNIYSDVNLNQQGINNGHGITVFKGDVNIHNNQIETNDDYGVFLDTLATENQVTNNNFINNNQAIQGQARDVGSNNIFGCNYWGASVSNPYLIDGGKSNDTCPSDSSYPYTANYFDFIPTTLLDSDDSDDDGLPIHIETIILGILGIMLIKRKKYSLN